MTNVLAAVEPAASLLLYNSYIPIVTPRVCTPLHARPSPGPTPRIPRARVRRLLPRGPPARHRDRTGSLHIQHTELVAPTIPKTATNRERAKRHGIRPRRLHTRGSRGEPGTAHASASAHGAWCGAHTPEPVATRVRATARNWYQVLAREPDPPRPRRPDPVYDLEVRTVGHPPRTTAHPATGGRIADPRVRHMYSLLTPWGTNTLARDRRRRGQFPFAPPFSRATATLSSVYEPRGRSQHACNGLFQRGVSIPRMRTACIG